MFESSIHFSRSMLQNVAVAGGVVEVGSGGIVKFDRTTFRDVVAEGDVWVTADSDDAWIFHPIGPAETVSLAGGAGRNVKRERLPPDAATAGGGDYAPAEVFYVEDDFLYDEAYGQFDYSGACSATYLLPAAGS